MKKISSCLIRISAAQKHLNKKGFYGGHIVWFISAIDPDALWVPCDLWALHKLSIKVQGGRDRFESDLLSESAVSELFHILLNLICC